MPRNAVVSSSGVPRMAPYVVPTASGSSAGTITSQSGPPPEPPEPPPKPPVPAPVVVALSAADRDEDAPVMSPPEPEPDAASLPFPPHAATKSSAANAQQDFMGGAHNTLRRRLSRGAGGAF